MIAEEGKGRVTTAPHRARPGSSGLRFIPLRSLALRPPSAQPPPRQVPLPEESSAVWWGTGTAATTARAAFLAPSQARSTWAAALLPGLSGARLPPGALIFRSVARVLRIPCHNLLSSLRSCGILAGANPCANAPAAPSGRSLPGRAQGFRGR